MNDQDWKDKFEDFMIHTRESLGSIASEVNLARKELDRSSGKMEKMESDIGSAKEACIKVDSQVDKKLITGTRWAVGIAVVAFGALYLHIHSVDEKRRDEEQSNSKETRQAIAAVGDKVNAGLQHQNDQVQRLNEKIAAEIGTIRDRVGPTDPRLKALEDRIEILQRELDATKRQGTDRK